MPEVLNDHVGAFAPELTADVAVPTLLAVPAEKFSPDIAMLVNVGEGPPVPTSVNA